MRINPNSTDTLRVAFLRDVKCLLVTGFDTHAQRYSVDGRTCEDVTGLVEWALDLDLIEYRDIDIKRREPGFVMALTAKGGTELATRRDALRMAAGLI